MDFLQSDEENDWLKVQEPTRGGLQTTKSKIGAISAMHKFVIYVIQMVKDEIMICDKFSEPLFETQFPPHIVQAQTMLCSQLKTEVTDRWTLHEL